MDTKQTKEPSVRQACAEAARGLLAAHGELRALDAWNGSRVPAAAKRSLNAVIADWVARNEPPLSVHARLAALINAEHPVVGEVRYQVRLAMVHHLRDGWAGTGAGAPVETIPPLDEPTPDLPPSGLDVETLVRQALAETAPEAEPEAAPEPPAPATPDAWECGLCGLVSDDQAALVTHIADCEGPVAPTEEEPLPPAGPALVFSYGGTEIHREPAPEEPAGSASPVDDSGGRYECALCGMVTEGQAVLEAHLAQCTGTGSSGRSSRRGSAVPKPASKKRSAKSRR
jgi:hypothetical protein